MASPEFLDVGPRSLHLLSDRMSGADPVKLHDQMVRFGSHVDVMPGRTVRVEVMRTIARPVGHLPLLGDTLP